MAIEIERKFLVISDAFKQESHQKKYIKQGFLNSEKERVVRVRLQDDVGFLTVKGKTNSSGTSRFEWETELTPTDTAQLLTLCEKGIIEKYRYLVNANNHIFEVDEFLGDNSGLFIAEIELTSESEVFTKPDWLGEEVTGKPEYYNSNLSKHPFKNWI